MDVREFFDVGYAVDLILVSVEQIVIAQQEKHVIEIIVELLETANTIIERAHVDDAAVMMPVAAEDAVLAAPFLGLLNHPFDELLTAGIVFSAVVAETIM